MSRDTKEGEPLDFEQYRKKLEEQGLLGLSGPDRLMKYLGLPPEAKYDIEDALFDVLPQDVVSNMFARRAVNSTESLGKKSRLTRKRAQNPQIKPL